MENKTNTVATAMVRWADQGYFDGGHRFTAGVCTETGEVFLRLHKFGCADKVNKYRGTRALTEMARKVTEATGRGVYTSLSCALYDMIHQELPNARFPRP